MIFRLTFLFNFLKRSSVYLEWILRIIDILLPFLWDYFITLSLLAPIELQIFKTIRDCQHHPPLGHVWEQAPPGHTESQSGWDPHLVSRDPSPSPVLFRMSPCLSCVFLHLVRHSMNLYTFPGTESRSPLSFSASPLVSSPPWQVLIWQRPPELQDFFSL